MTDSTKGYMRVWGTVPGCEYGGPSTGHNKGGGCGIQGGHYRSNWPGSFGQNVCWCDGVRA